MCSSLVLMRNSATLVVSEHTSADVSCLHRLCAAVSWRSCAARGISFASLAAAARAVREGALREGRVSESIGKNHPTAKRLHSTEPLRGPVVSSDVQQPARARVRSSSCPRGSIHPLLKPSSVTSTTRLSDNPVRSPLFVQTLSRVLLSSSFPVCATSRMRGSVARQSADSSVGELLLSESGELSCPFFQRPHTLGRLRHELLH